MAAARIQRWALILAGYEYEILYKEGKKNGNADCLSRLPLKETVGVPLPGETILLVERLDGTPVHAEEIEEWTQSDPLLRQVMNFIQNGWKEKNSNEKLRPYFSRRNELSTHEGCILWGSRVVIPEPGREKLLDLLHEGHPGIVRMKSLARSYLWWPGLDEDIERKVLGCEDCQMQSATPAVAPLHPWEWPDRPWSRIHADYAGPFMGSMFLIIIDAYSKWIEVFKTSTSTSEVTMEKFRQAFATHGIPDVLVTDNGTCFTSHEFAIFTSENGIQHVKTSPYHPASNGLAERAVRIFKEGMKKMDKGHGSLTTKLQRFLLNYRTTPQTTTGVAPAELLMNRKLRTKLDFVKPEIRERVGNRQRKFKQYHDLHAKGRTFMEGDAVMTKSFPSGRWKCGEITQQTGPVSYKVAFLDGVTARRHVDHIKQRHFIPRMEADNPDESGSYYEPPTVEEAPRSATVQPESEFKANASLPLPSTSRPSSVPTVASPRRSLRSTKKPAYLDDYVTP